jgi:hypothetical protein
VALVWSGGRYGENCEELGDGNVLHDDDVCCFVLLKCLFYEKR